jgi:hypothetical protein
VLGYAGTEPHLVIDATTVDDASGNNNGRLDPGETVDLTLTLLNDGGSDLTNLTTTLQTTDPYLTVTDNTGTFGSLPVDSMKENTGDPYSIMASASAPHGICSDMQVIATADGGFVDTLEFTLLVGQPVPSDTGRYYAYASTGPHANAPVYGWIGIDSTQSVNPGVSLDLIDNQTVTVSLPFTFRYYGINYSQISVCSNGWIAMGSQTDADWTNSSIPLADGPSAMIAGLWDDLDPGNPGQPSDIYYYNDAANHRFIIEYFDVEHYPSGYNETFEIILLDPAYYPTPTGDGEIIVQYLIEQQQVDNTIGIENSSETVGIQYFLNNVYHSAAEPVIDQFAVKFTTWPPDQNPGVEENSTNTPISSKALLSVYPNVTKTGVTIHYSCPGIFAESSIKIYDATGSLVKTFEVTRNNATVSWDGRDDAGMKLAGGVYFVTLETQDARTSTKVIVVD